MKWHFEKTLPFFKLHCLYNVDVDPIVHVRTKFPTQKQNFLITFSPQSEMVIKTQRKRKTTNNGNKNSLNLHLSPVGFPHRHR